MVALLASHKDLGFFNEPDWSTDSLRPHESHEYPASRRIIYAISRFMRKGMGHTEV